MNKIIKTIIRLLTILFITQVSFAQGIDSILYTKLEAKGEWKSYYQLNENGDYDFIPKSAEIDSIYFFADGSMKQKVLERLFQPLMGLKTQKRALSQFKTIQSAYPFINDDSNLSFAQYNQKQVAAVVAFQPQFKSQIGGILGGSKGKDGKWITTGEIDLHLENLQGEGTIMDLQWRQPNERSRFLKLAYETPFPFGLPFGTDIEFQQDFLEDQYIIESTTGSATGIGPLGQWRIGGKKESSNDLTNETKFESESVILGLRGDRRNNRWMPSKGRFWEGEIALGRFEDELGKTKVVEMDLRYAFYRPLDQGVFFWSIHGEGIWVDERDLPLAKKVQFGGASSLRGYHENQFGADWVIINTVEWIMGDLDRSQAFLFVDTPLTEVTPIKPGYGLGFRQYNGTLSLDIAAGFSSRSKNAKIHLKFSSDL